MTHHLTSLVIAKEVRMKGAEDNTHVKHNSNCAWYSERNIWRQKSNKVQYPLRDSDNNKWRKGVLFTVSLSMHVPELRLLIELAIPIVFCFAGDIDYVSYSMVTHPVEDQDSLK